ncbi:AmpG family muropeptide MFS transporter [Dolichospermum circinale]|uniref:AmpG family muropeptide MFS transporter n=1 Tax=Dolichospermum circinale TaxID=109265 RepID=UPI00041EBEF7|nr:AmpG family muropeptide MFS transporter [Dolichospermum circinale]MDB9474420.1 AmpG family muropeptide MFS transporter [Dolichospermum circinale CS-537/11]MDB9478787.1 AmpG family muropeptide MFS transporter [Dolichospermum circinale CS-537/03]
MKEIQALRQAFQSQKMVALLLLGFASGLPLFLTSRTLQLWMQDAKVDIASITLFGLLGLPYSLKFLWSPLLDRFTPPFLDGRRGWLIITQIGLVLAIATLAIQQPAQNDQILQILAINCLIITFLSATQDIAGDAYRTDILNPLEAQPGASVWVLGYRIALFITSSLALVLADYLPWNVVYFLMAVIMAGSIFTTLLSPREHKLQDKTQLAPISREDVIFIVLITLLVAGLIAGVFVGFIPQPVFYWLLAGLLVAWITASLLLPNSLLNEITEDSPLQNLQTAIFLPFKEFFHRFGIKQASLTLGFILLYKLGDSLVGITANLFLREIDFTKTEIGTIQAGMGFIATTVGVLAGGVIMTKINLNRSLWVFGALQLLSNLGYYALAIANKKDYSLLVIAVNIENFSAGLVTVATVAFLMSLCNHRFTTTQFALFSSLMAISRDVLSASAGSWATARGWPTFFLLSLVAALPGLLLLPMVAPWHPKPLAINRPGLEEEDIWDLK